ncbi:protein O-mannosyl-transferase 1-like [Lethenteron reissneri]|uniref:protein O-mannosyl-transferase 1-like n=1 Tax=Lethenteron reissneri TaxID=7753 RepID=UPI002AB60177|nr:protein O-mannosyl-transferase 1-like [Lethenteron reissneri]
MENILALPKRPLSVRLSVEVDVGLVLLTLLALWSRLGGLAYPGAVVFDEVYYGQFVSLYVNGVFFVDQSGPPLGHMLLALGAYLGDFNGNFTWERIGAEYNAAVPVRALRAVPALCGALTVPLAYLISTQLGLSPLGAILAGLLMLMDNALLTQSRFVLLEPLLICFSLLSVLCALKLRTARSFSVSWWGWLLATGTACGLAIGVKYTGVLTLLLVCTLAASDIWRLAGDRTLTHLCVCAHVVARVAGFLLLPLLLYVATFWLHLQLLQNTGPHDHLMSSAFQASLKGGLARITQGQPLEVAFGSQVTLRNAHTPCWLHSHRDVYPITYVNKKGSSHQQQVTCYPYKDINNWWIVKHPHSQSLVVDSPPVPVRHGDIVQLLHGMSTRLLNSHNVAAPITPTCQEVSCYVDYNISMQAQPWWRVEVLNRASDKDSWKTIVSDVQLVHVNTSAVLRVSGAVLPEWGHGQPEVVADLTLRPVHPGSRWNVEEHRHGRSQEQAEREQELRSPIPKHIPHDLGFLAKFYELQWKMLTFPVEEQEHRYISTPLQWLRMSSSIAYWMDPHTNAQIHLLPNPLLWVSGCVCLLLYCACLVRYLLRRQRAISDLPAECWERFLLAGWLGLGGWAMHFVPYLLTERGLFLYHYLPAATFHTLLIPALLEHAHTHVVRSLAGRYALLAGCVAWLATVYASHVQLAPLSMGTPALSAQQLTSLRWSEGWDFLVHPTQ